MKEMYDRKKSKAKGKKEKGDLKGGDNRPERRGGAPGGQAG